MMSHERATDATWLLLLALTAGMFAAADRPDVALALVLGLAVLKALLVATVFMELHRQPLILALCGSAIIGTGGLLVYLAG